MAGALAYGEGILSSPSVATPWVEFADDYTGQCVQSADGTDVLAVRLRTRAAPALTPSPNADWGLHVDDSNIALGDLVEVVEQQALLSKRTPARPPSPGDRGAAGARPVTGTSPANGGRP